MKYAMLVIEGAADGPVESLGGRTPLEAAVAPVTSACAISGRVGRVTTIPGGCEPSAALGLLTLLGYGEEHDPGPAGFDAATLGLSLADSDRVLCVTFASHAQPDGSARPELRPCPGLSEAEVGALASDVLADWKARYASLCGAWSLAGVVEGRAILHVPHGELLTDIDTTPPARAYGHDPDRLHPRGPARVADALSGMITASTDRLTSHEINAVRAEHDLPPVTVAWPWGVGRGLQLSPFRTVHQVRTLLVTDSPMASAIGQAAGITVERPAGDSLAHVGRDAARGVRAADLLVVYVRANHAPLDAVAKAAFLSEIDRNIVQPLAGALEQDSPPAEKGSPPQWRFLIVPTHLRSSETGAHSPDPVPFAFCGAWVRSHVERHFTEACGAESDLSVNPGKDLLEYVLRSGLVGRRR